MDKERSITVTCAICKKPIQTRSFEDYQCGNCGQKYEFNEGVMIVLTEDQYQALSDLQNQIEKERELVNCG